MVMGDLVLTETEIKPVMTKILQSGLEVTALHNHSCARRRKLFTCMSADTVTR